MRVRNDIDTKKFITLIVRYILQKMRPKYHVSLFLISKRLSNNEPKMNPITSNLKGQETEENKVSYGHVQCINVRTSDHWAVISQHTDNDNYIANKTNDKNQPIKPEQSLVMNL